MSEERRLTIDEAAAYLQLSVSTTRKLVRERRVLHYRVGRKLQFTKTDLDAYLASVRHGGGVEVEI